MLVVGVRPSCVIQAPAVESGSSGPNGQTAPSPAEAESRHEIELVPALLVKATVSVQGGVFE